MRKVGKICLYVIPSLLSIALGFFCFTWFMGKPQIGVINISGIITHPKPGEDITRMLQYTLQNRRIKAVVMTIDSPGGGASSVEDLYFDALRLKAQKPVVASINRQAASGGYYLAVAADYIYTKPTAFVGSIGAWTQLPEPEAVEEDIISTGPSKLTGIVRKKAVLQLETVKEGFLYVVMSQRGERLKISKEDLSRAEIYTGIEAVKNGMVDKIGSTTDAIEKAAEYAGIRNYDVIDINKELGIQAPSLFFFMRPSDLPASLTPVNYYLYMVTE